MAKENDDFWVYEGDDLFHERLDKKMKREGRRRKKRQHKKKGNPEEQEAPHTLESGQEPQESGVDWGAVSPEDLEPFAREVYEKIVRIGVIAKTDKFDQHFLVDPEAVRTVTEAADISGGDSVLEVGPGPGNLTENLWQVCRDVRAALSTIELDEHFRPLLEELPDSELIHMYWGDAIRELPSVVKREQINKVVANIPYSILEPLLKQIHASRSIQAAVLLVGKRYAERSVADFRDEDPRGDRFSKTSLFSQARFSPEIIAEVPRESFMPPPRTESAVVRLNPRKGKNVDFLTIANNLVKKPTMQVRAVLQNLLQQKFDKSKLQGIRSVEEAREVEGAIPPRVDQLGLPDELLKTSLQNLTNAQLQALLLKLDLLCKKKRRDKKITEEEQRENEEE